MKKRYCGACRGERGCVDCVSASKNAQYVGLTGFVNRDNAETEGSVPQEYLLAADIGTTTLAFVCTDEHGNVLSSYGCVNPQRRYAADVIGRVDYACGKDDTELTKILKEALVKGFLFVLKRAEKTYGGGRPIRFGIAGNTVMLHLLLGYPVEGLSKAPFVPFRTEGVKTGFTELFGVQQGLEGSVVILPCFSAFVGADLFAGAYYLDFFGQKKQKNCFLADFGTNGELLLLHDGRIYATSAAMGTAFEGGRFSYAADLFRLIAEARKEEQMDKYGLLSEPYFEEGFRGLLQEDVRVFQLAKGAIRAGIEILLGRAGISAAEVSEVFLAGGLGEFCNQEDFFDTGLLPGAFRGKLSVVGNGCIGGLVKYLKNREEMLTCEADVINLAECPSFEEAYYAYMNFEEEA